jgi:phosphoglucomutase
MKIDLRASRPANASDLVDVPKLIAVCCEERPDPYIPEQRVLFTKSGHRGFSFEKTFNEWHILAIAKVICAYRKQQKIDGRLFLGTDNHSLSQPAVDNALEHITTTDIHAADLAREKPITIIAKAAEDGKSC